MHDTFAFLTEANMARNQHLTVFQRNLEKWAEAYQRKVANLELLHLSPEHQEEQIAT